MNHLRRARSTERNVIGRPMSTTVWETRSRYQDLLFGGVSSHSWRPSGARSVLRCMPSELFELAGGRQSGGGRLSSETEVQPARGVPFQTCSSAVMAADNQSLLRGSSTGLIHARTGAEGHGGSTLNAVCCALSARRRLPVGVFATYAGDARFRQTSPLKHHRRQGRASDIASRNSSIVGR